MDAGGTGQTRAGQPVIFLFCFAPHDFRLTHPHLAGIGAWFEPADGMVELSGGLVANWRTQLLEAPLSTFGCQRAVYGGYVFE